jgi:hypothetical protein
MPIDPTIAERLREALAEARDLRARCADLIDLARALDPEAELDEESPEVMAAVAATLCGRVEDELEHLASA